MKKVVAVLTLLSMLLLLLPAMASANSQIKLFLDGTELKSDTAPKLVNGTVLVPIKVIAEQLGSDVTWDKPTQEVTVLNEGLEIILHIGSKDAEVNGQPYKLSASPLIVQNRTMLPLRFIGENMGLKVLWDAKNHAVLLQRSEPVQPEPPVTEPAPPEEPGTELPSDPGAVLAQIQDIYLQGDSVIVQTDGAVAPSSFKLDNPDRIVVDLPATDFLPDFLQYNGSGSLVAPYSGEMAVDHPIISKLRFSLYSEEENIIRIVVDLKSKSNHQVTYDSSLQQVIISLTAAVTPPSSSRYKVVIDPGHGGTDPGASGITGYREKAFTLAVGLKVNKLLEQEPRLQVIMTRTGDTYPTLSDRSALANNAKADLFISIHGNSLVGSKATGIESYYLHQNSGAFAKIIHKNLLAATNMSDRKVRVENFHVVRETKMPAVLLELGFLSNASDEAKMKSESYQQKCAEAIVQSIKEYFNIS
ncbi:N-acetylmuramoyl-L-alanine amidase [Paenibacillus gansuensis]|uniref:N-acetylmuramoyl-L-alanine amidase n=1 Tax=Paenibacillus gansuensis TaxID=306542 RepID=A0ABW5PAU3_9BACL